MLTRIRHSNYFCHFPFGNLPLVHHIVSGLQVLANKSWSAGHESYSADDSETPEVLIDLVPRVYDAAASNNSDEITSTQEIQTPLVMPLSPSGDSSADPFATSSHSPSTFPSSLDTFRTVSEQPGRVARARRTVSRRAREALEESNNICNICEKEISESLASADLLCCDGPSCDEKVNMILTTFLKD